jgi:hypothetical protein
VRHRRLGIIAAATALVVLAAACEAVPGDFTGDRKADLVYEVENHTDPANPYYLFYEVGQSTPLYTGQPGDFPVPGDYDGDLKWEPAVLRGTTWISSALASPIEYDPAGMPSGPPGTPSSPYIIGSPTPPTLIPVPGDYDGTGKMVPAYYDQVDASWWIMGHNGSVQFGVAPTNGGTLGYDVPVPADYDGDHKTDIAVYRPTDGTFHYLSSKTGQEVTVSVGSPGAFPVPADYDKVGHAEPAVVGQVGPYGPASSYAWYVAGGAAPLATFTTSGAVVPAPGDYDGDGHADAALLDTGSGAWEVAGQPPLATGLTGAVAPTEVPIGTLLDVVRLNVYGQCLGYVAEFNKANLC